jgi:hypothetical protein
MRARQTFPPVHPRAPREPQFPHEGVATLRALSPLDRHALNTVTRLALRLRLFRLFARPVQAINPRADCRGERV